LTPSCTVGLFFCCCALLAMGSGSVDTERQAPATLNAGLNAMVGHAQSIRTAPRAFITKEQEDGEMSVTKNDVFLRGSQSLPLLCVVDDDSESGSSSSPPWGAPSMLPDSNFHCSKMGPAGFNFLESDKDLPAMGALCRHASFSSFGYLDRVQFLGSARAANSIHGSSDDFRAREPPTPRRRSATTDHIVAQQPALPLEAFFDFDDLDALEEADLDDDAVSTAPSAAGSASKVEQEARLPPLKPLPRSNTAASLANGLFDFAQLSPSAWSPPAGSSPDLRRRRTSATPRRPSPSAPLRDGLFDWDRLEEPDTCTVGAKPKREASFGFGNSNVAPMSFSEFLTRSKSNSAVPPEMQSESLPSLLLQKQQTQDDIFKLKSESTPSPPADACIANAPMAKRQRANSEEPCRCARVALIVNGSHGDILPVLALAKQLQKLRHQVQILTNADHLEFCQKEGVDAIATFADCRAVIEDVGGMSSEIPGNALSASWRRCGKSAEAWLRANPDACQAVDDCLEDFGPDAVICGTQASGPGMRLEAGAGVPSIYFGLSRVQMEFSEAFFSLQPPRPSFLAVSPTFEPVDMSEYPPNVVQTGPWCLEVADSDEFGDLAELKAFLSAGSKPVAIGWGSMIEEGLSPAAMLGVAIASLKASGNRGVILGGWAKLHLLGQRLVQHGCLTGLLDNIGKSYGNEAELAAFAATEVCFVQEAPHAWLLPQCSLMVHHGGAGTSQAALRAGIPSVLTPIYADQFLHVKNLHNLKVGIGFEKSLKELSPRLIADAIEASLQCSLRARRLGIKVRNEADSGVKDAARIIDRFLHADVLTGRWAEQLRQTHQPQPLLLSSAKPKQTSGVAK